MKNVSFTAGPKSGGFVTARMSTLHHSAEHRLSTGEIVFVGLIVLALVGFALALVN
jgi:hypothetical protein